MNILLIYPKYPDTFWSFKYALKFISRKASFPPLGLLIVTARVGLPNAPRGTRLYQRLKKEGRLLSDTSGDNTDCSMNFIPKMNYETLITGYKKILHNIYLPKHYYKRVRIFLRHYKSKKLGKKIYFKIDYLKAFLKSAWVLGIRRRERVHYWGLIIWTLVRRPQFFGISIAFAIFGFHFRKILGK